VGSFVQTNPTNNQQQQESTTKRKKRKKEKEDEWSTEKVTSRLPEVGSWTPSNREAQLWNNVSRDSVCIGRLHELGDRTDRRVCKRPTKE